MNLTISLRRATKCLCWVQIDLNLIAALDSMCLVTLPCVRSVPGVQLAVCWWWEEKLEAVTQWLITLREPTCPFAWYSSCVCVYLWPCRIVRDNRINVHVSPGCSVYWHPHALAFPLRHFHIMKCVPVFPGPPQATQALPFVQSHTATTHCSPTGSHVRTLHLHLVRPWSLRLWWFYLNWGFGCSRIR